MGWGSLSGGGGGGSEFTPGTGSARGAKTGASSAAPSPGQGVTYFTDQSFVVILAATNVPQQCPAFAVPRGCTVRVRATNGTGTGNAGIVFVQRFREDSGKPLAPLDDVACPVDNTVRLWFKGTLGDGVVVNVITSGSLSA
jgi:hypothetical protein